MKTETDQQFEEMGILEMCKVLGQMGEAMKKPNNPATPFECFEYRAKKFEEKYHVLPPGKDSWEPRNDDTIVLWRDFGRFVPCICGKEIPEEIQ